MRNGLLSIILSLPAVLLAFTFHEYAHARIADALGDKTPRFQGRLTLNPIAHIDPIGFLMLLFFKFGWAKPVQVNRNAFRNYYKDDLKVSLAGPMANLILAVIAAFVYEFLIRFYPSLNAGLIYTLISIIVQLTIIININLAIFNLLPLPGLDGFSILEDLFPRTFAKYSDQLYRYQFIIFIALVFAGGRILMIPSNFIYNIIMKIASAIVFL